MKLSQITTLLSSQRLVAATHRYMLWSRLSAMVATYPRLARAEMNAHKSASALKVVQQFDSTLAEFWAIYAVSSSRGMEYDIAEELDRMTSTPRKMTPADQIAKLAEATGLPITTITETMQKQRNTAMAQAIETRAALEQRIYDAEFSGVDAEDENALDPECSAEIIDSQAEKLVLWLATWSKPDWAELVVIKADREMLIKRAEIEEHVDETPGFDGVSTAASRGELRSVHLLNKAA